MSRSLVSLVVLCLCSLILSAWGDASYKVKCDSVSIEGLDCAPCDALASQFLEEGGDFCQFPCPHQSNLLLSHAN